eukprot:SAG22_NODE_1774_length_3609_cov_3.611681_3_plen_349_part_00
MFFTLGSYTAGGHGTAGTWQAIGGRESAGGTVIDRGQLFAGKDMWDPVKRRRLYWGWAHNVPPASALTLAREISWHGLLQQFVYSPLAEQSLLRGAQLPTAAIPGTQVPAMPGRLWLSEGWAHGAGNTTEIVVTFALPAGPARLGVVVMAGTTARDAAGPAAGALYDGTLFYVDYRPKPATSGGGGAWTVGVGAMDMHPVAMDLRGDGNRAAVSAAGDGQQEQQQQQQQHERRRQDEYLPYGRGTSAGPPAAWPPYSSKLQLLLGADINLTLTIYVENTFAECFFMHGRTVLTRTVGQPSPGLPRLAAGVAVVANTSGVQLENAAVWRVGSAWVAPEQVLATPRPTRG